MSVVTRSFPYYSPHLKADCTVLLGAGFTHGITDLAKRNGSKINYPLPLGKQVLSQTYMSKKEFRPDARFEAYDIDENWFYDPNATIPKMLFRAFGAYYDDHTGWLEPRRIIDPKTGEVIDRPANYELLFSHCRLKADSPLTSQEFRSEYVKCQYILSQYICKLLNVNNYFTSKCKCNVLSKLISQFFNKLPNHTNVFTTNVDNLIENMYEDRDSEWNYEFLFRQEIPFGEAYKSAYFKLHGSIDWLSCSNVNCPRFIHPLERPIEGIHNQDFCPFCGHVLYPEILPPTITKDYYSKPYYSKMIRHLRESLRTSMYFVVVGYSFSEYDTMLTSWIANPTKRTQPLKLIIVDSNVEDVKRIAKGICDGTEEIIGYERIDEFEL